MPPTPPKVIIEETEKPKYYLLPQADRRAFGGGAGRVGGAVADVDVGLAMGVSGRRRGDPGVYDRPAAVAPPLGRGPRPHHSPAPKSHRRPSHGLGVAGLALAVDGVVLFFCGAN